MNNPLPADLPRRVDTPAEVPAKDGTDFRLPPAQVPVDALVADLTGIARDLINESIQRRRACRLPDDIVPTRFPGHA